ncbi:Ribose-phosphate pyrophosphokinase [Candidatus Protochlamydia naegleriophila]|uniref:Ribose-phosphate pyrophosphokinase n=1 Tax=Candidatus Protochlamydia naegleriophila TaxID=389348 RepID=A0A0U5ESG8_9BACT|nr:ribose-phosphate pyrophosphokinase [Candidatus Protochlamydia naegleriophila]CUI17187.1 Ribose-phosphate pyrophosphokinase [Candidatus Protochlamydia naegleriophila]
MSFSFPQPLLFAGSSHLLLATEVASQLGISLGQVQLNQFPDGEIAVQILESVRGRDVFVLQSIALDPNFYLMELLIIVDALKRASARSVVAVIPYFGYCRQDRKDKPRVPITAKLVANLLVEAGVTRILAVDLHAGQLQGFFDIPVDHVHGRQLLIDGLRDLELSRCVVVAPDIGSVKTARAFAGQLQVDFAVVDKHRLSAMEVGGLSLIGDVNGKDVLLADDMCSTGATLVSAAKACQEKGAKRIFGVITHGLFVDDAVNRIENSLLESVWMTNTIPYTERLKDGHKLKTISIAPLLAHAIQCIVSDESISSL